MRFSIVNFNGFHSFSLKMCTILVGLHGKSFSPKGLKGQTLYQKMYFKSRAENDLKYPRFGLFFQVGSTLECAISVNNARLGTILLPVRSTFPGP